MKRAVKIVALSLLAIGLPAFVWSVRSTPVGIGFRIPSVFAQAIWQQKCVSPMMPITLGGWQFANLTNDQLIQWGCIDKYANISIAGNVYVANQSGCMSTQAQQAISDLPNGGTVIFPPGQFNVNLTLPTGYTLKGSTSGGMFPGSGSSLTPSQLISCVGTSPTITTQADANGVVRVRIEGLLLQGVGSGASDQGVNIPSGAGWVQIIDDSFVNYGQQAVYQNPASNSVLNIDRSLLIGLLQSSASQRGVIETHGPNARFRNLEVSAGQTSSSTNGNNCAVLVDSSFGWFGQIIAEQADRGFCLTSNATIDLFYNDNANLVYGHGWLIQGSGSNKFTNCIASNFGQGTANTFDGFNLDANSNANMFVNTEILINGGFLSARYGINDASNAGGGNKFFATDFQGTFGTAKTNITGITAIYDSQQTFTFATLPAWGNGSRLYCTDCNLTCTAGASTGRNCSRENGAWVGF